MTVDDGQGDVRANGMQFAVNGYTISGDTLTLVNTTGTPAASPIAVGDGSSASAGMTATIASNITGNIAVKTGPGTLVLSGNNSFGEITGSVSVKGASGDISAELLAGELDAKTASGSLRIADAVRGRTSLTTAAGGIDIGIHEGTAAWLDVNATAGQVRNSLDTATGPEDSSDTVRITARNYAGDIFVRRTHLVS